MKEFADSTQLIACTHKVGPIVGDLSTCEKLRFNNDSVMRSVVISKWNALVAKHTNTHR